MQCCRTWFSMRYNFSFFVFSFNQQVHVVACLSVFNCSLHSSLCQLYVPTGSCSINKWSIKLDYCSHLKGRWGPCCFYTCMSLFPQAKYMQFGWTESSEGLIVKMFACVCQPCAQHILINACWDRLHSTPQLWKGGIEIIKWEPTAMWEAARCWFYF